MSTDLLWWAFCACCSALVYVIDKIGTRAIDGQAKLADKMEVGFATVNVNFEKVNERFMEMNTTLSTIERDLRSEVSDIRSRVAHIEGTLKQ